MTSLLNAARMLGKPGDAEWVLRELADRVSRNSGSLVIPLGDIRRYADRNSIPITPLDNNVPSMWICARPSAEQTGL